jgi:hypothetical protein
VPEDLLVGAVRPRTQECVAVERAPRVLLVADQVDRALLLQQRAARLQHRPIDVEHLGAPIEIAAAFLDHAVEPGQGDLAVDDGIAAPLGELFRLRDLCREFHLRRDELGPDLGTSLVHEGAYGVEADEGDRAAEADPHKDQFFHCSPPFGFKNQPRALARSRLRVLPHGWLNRNGHAMHCGIR